MQVGTLPYHLPAFRTPFIGIFNQKIRRKAYVYGLSRFDFVCSRFIFSHRGVEVIRLYDIVRIDPTFQIALMDVTIPASLALFVAAAPRIPYSHIRFLNSSISVLSRTTRFISCLSFLGRSCHPPTGSSICRFDRTASYPDIRFRFRFSDWHK